MQKPDFNFTSIHIIESLGESAGEPGKKLKERLDHASRIADSIPIFYHFAFDEADMVAALERIYKEQQTDQGTPVLHFEVHGGAEGISLRNGSTMQWNRLAAILSKFNLSMEFQLLVILACCDGIHQINSLRIGAPCPFRALVGCQGTVHTEDLLNGFGAFYDEVFSTGKVLKAVELLQAKIRPNTAAFVFFSAEKAFVITAAKVYSENRNQQAVSKRIADIRPKVEVRRALEGILTPVSAAEMERVLAESEKTAINSFWENFFAIQRLPKNRETFDRERLWNLAIEYAERAQWDED